MAITKDFKIRLEIESNSTKVLSETEKAALKYAKSAQEAAKGVDQFVKQQRQAILVNEQSSKAMKEATETSIALKGGLVAAGVAAATYAAKNYDKMKTAAYGASEAVGFMRSNHEKFVALAQSSESIFSKAFKSFSMGFEGGRQAAQKFNTTAGSTFKTATVGLIGLTEAAVLAGPTLITIGSSMQELESKTGRVIGKISIFAGILAVSFGAAVVYAVKTTGMFVAALGDKLIGAMEKFQNKAIELESSVASLAFTIQGFGRELGEQAVGTVEQWQGAINNLVKTTIFGQKEISKAVSFLVSEGTSLGLSLEQNMAILARAADIASAKGKSIEEVTGAILNAITGNSQALFNMGVDVRDVALAHSKYIEEAGKTVEQLTELEKQQARMSLVFSKSSGFIGAAANAVNTTKGAYAQYEKQLEQVQATLGKQGVLTTFIISLQTKLATAILSVPQPLLELIGTMQDFLGITLKIVGTILHYSFTILTLTTVYKLLGIAVVRYTVVQSALNLLFSASGALIGVNVVAATSLGAVWTNLAIIARGLAANLGGILLKALTAVGGAMMRLVVMIAPLAIKIGLVVAVVYAFVNAFKKLYEENEAFRNLVSGVVEVVVGIKETILDAVGATGMFSKGWESLTDILKVSMGVLTDVATLIIVGLTQSALLGYAAFLKLKKGITTNPQELAKLNTELDATLDQISGLSSASGKAVTSLLALGDSTAYAAGATKDATGALKDFNLNTHTTSDDIERLVNTNLKGFDKVTERIKIMGTEFEKARVAQVEAQRELTKANNLTAHAAEKAKAIAEARIEVFKAETNAAKLRADTIKDIERETASLQSENLKAAGDAAAAIKLDFAERRKNLDDQVKGMQLLGKLRDDDIKKIDAARDALARAEEYQLKEEEMKKLKAAVGSVGDDLNRLVEKTADYRMELAKQTATTREAIDLEQERAMVTADQLEKNLKLLSKDGKLTEEQVKILKEYRDVVMETANAQKNLGDIAIGDIASGKIDWGAEFANAGVQLVKSAQTAIRRISLKDIGGGIISAFQTGAEIAVGLLSGDYLNKFADILESITTVPEKFVAVFERMGDILQKFLENLPQMIMKIVQAVPKMVDKFVEAFPRVIDGLIAALPRISQVLAQQLPRILQAVLDAIPKIIQALPQILAPLIRAIPGMVAQIVEALPEVVTAIFDALPQIFAEIFKAIPGIVENFLEHIDEFVLAFVEGFIGAMGEIVVAFIDEFLLGGGIERIVGALLRAIPRIAVALVQGIVRGLARAIGALFGGSNFKLPSAITELPNKIAKGAEKLGKNIAKEASQIFQVKDLESALGGMDPGKAITEAISNAFEFILPKFMNIGEMLKKAWLWIYNTILKPFLDLLKKAWTWIYDNILKPVIDMLAEIWQFVWDTFLKPFVDGVRMVFSYIYNTFLKPFVDALRAVWNFVYNSIWLPIINTLRAVWQAVYDFFNNIFKGRIAEAFAGIWEKFKEVGSMIWQAIANGLSNAGKLFMSLGTSIWDGLKNAISSGAKVFTDIGKSIWNSLKDGLSSVGSIFEKALNALRPDKILERVFKVDGKGKGAVEKVLGIDVPFANFAQGGVVPGKAMVPGDSLMNDRILALISPGEAVIPRSKMDNPAIKQIVASILSGDFMPPRYAFGSGGDWNPLDDGGGWGNPFAPISDALGDAWDGISGFAKSQLGPIAGQIASWVSPEQLESLGDWFTKSGQSLSTAKIGEMISGGVDLSWGDLLKIQEMGAHWWKQTMQIGKDAIDFAIETAKDPLAALRQLDPRELWKRAKAEGQKAASRALGANTPLMHTGGMIPSFAGGGIAGDVPIIGQAGEFVINRRSTQNNMPLLSAINNGMDVRGGNGGGGVVIQKIEINAKTNLDADSIRREVIPAVEKHLRRVSQDGQRVLDPAGVRK